VLEDLQVLNLEAVFGNGGPDDRTEEEDYEYEFKK